MRQIGFPDLLVKLLQRAIGKAGPNGVNVRHRAAVVEPKSGGEHALQMVFAMESRARSGLAISIRAIHALNKGWFRRHAVFGDCLDARRYKRFMSRVRIGVVLISNSMVDLARGREPPCGFMRNQL